MEAKGAQHFAATLGKKQRFAIANAAIARVAIEAAIEAARAAQTG